MVGLTKRDGVELDVVPASILATPCMRRLCGFFLQSSHEDDNPADIANYGNPTLAKCQAIHNHTYEAYLTVSMLLSLDR